MNNKILFLGVNASYSHTMLSYGYIRAYTQTFTNKWTWVFKEYTIKDDLDNICHDIISEDPVFVIASTYLFNCEYIIKIMNILKSMIPNTLIVLGGPEFFGKNEKFLRHNPQVDAVIRGDETSFHFLLDNIQTKESWIKIPGLCMIFDNLYYDNGISCLSDGTHIINSPYFDEVVSRKKPFIQLETTRGCKGKCAFCTSALCRYVEILTPAIIVREIIFLQNAGFTEIRLIDRTFNENDHRAIQILNLFLNHFPTIKFHLEFNPALVSEEILKSLGKFPKGQLHIEVGIQSLDQNVATAVKRYGSIQDALKGLEFLANLDNIELHADLIAGMPHQSFESVVEDMLTLIEIMPSELQIEILKILPGTPLADSHNQILTFESHPPYRVLKTSTMTYDEIISVKIVSRIIDGFYNTPALRSIFRFTALKYKSFIYDFIEFYSTKSSNASKLHLNKRFYLLKEFIAKYNDSTANDLLKFSWLAAGMPIKEYNIKSSSGKKVNDDLSIFEIWQKKSNEKSKRSYIVHFSWNTGDLWLDSRSNISHTKTSYLFRLAYGNNPKSISVIRHK